MWTPAIIKVQVAADRSAGLANAVVGIEINLLVFNAAPQPLDEHVVPPGALAVHADGDPVFDQNASECRAGELAALIRVEDIRLAVTSQSVGRFDALAVDDCACGTGLAADPFAIEHDQGVVDLLEATLVAERRKPATDCAPRRQIARQQTPRTARPHHIEDAVDDLSHWPCTRPSRTLRSRQVGLNHAPFLIGHVSLVSVRLADMLHSSDWGPHGISGIGLSNPLESRRSQPLNLFRNGLLDNQFSNDMLNINRLK